MPLRNTPAGYGLIAQLLHWIVAGLIGYQYVLATRAADASLFQKLGILATHKSIGITILTLAALRLVWSYGVGPHPAPPPAEPLYRRRLAAISHAALYALMIAMPVTGWIMSSAANTPVSVFGRLTLPNLVRPHSDWVDTLKSVHGMLFEVLAVIVAVHVLAAMYHHFMLRDTVLRRMIPFVSVGPCRER
jgi:cytochrome b561